MTWSIDYNQIGYEKLIRMAFLGIKKGTELFHKLYLAEYLIIQHPKKNYAFYFLFY